MDAPTKRRERGSALVEFAIGWSVLWLLFAGVWEFGYSFYVYSALLTAVSGAAELGAKMDYDTGNPTAFTTALQNMVVYGDEAAGNTPIVRGLSTANVNVSVNLDAQSMPRDVTVNVQNYAINSIFQSFTLTNKPRATTMFYGQISCSTC